MRRVSLRFVVLGVLGVVSVSCGRDTADTAAENAIETAIEASGQDADVTVKSDTMQIKTDDANMTMGEGTKVPDEWPDDVPVYKGLQVLMAMSSADGSVVQGTTADSMEKVFAFYKDTMSKGGWTEESALTQPQMSMLNFKKEERTAAVMITAADATTSVSLSLNSN